MARRSGAAVLLLVALALPGRAQVAPPPTGTPPDPCDAALGALERLQAIRAIQLELDACTEETLGGAGDPASLRPPLVEIRAACEAIATRIDLFLEGTTLPGVIPDTPLPGNPCADPSLDAEDRLFAVGGALRHLDGCLASALGTVSAPDPPLLEALDAIAAGCQTTIARVDAFLGALPPPTAPEPGSAALIRPIQAGVDALRQGGTLSKGQHQTLRRRLDRSLAAAFLADPVGTLRHLDRFLRKTASFVAEGVLTTAQGAQLLALADSAVQGVRAAVFLRPAVPPAGDPCPEPPPCVPTVYHVGALPLGLARRDFDVPGPPPDGSAERPFPSILSALERADELDLCAVELLLRSGCYPGDLRISRPTTITGDWLVKILGSIENRGPHALALDSVEILREAPLCELLAGSSLEGAIQVDHPCARTTLRRVTIGGAERYGIVQRGGELTVRNTSIEAPRADLRVAHDPGRVTGAGISLADGVDALLEDVHVIGPERYGIRQRGGTLTARRLFLSGARAQEELSAAGTAIWLSDGVRALIDDSDVRASGSSALIVEDPGTQLEAVRLRAWDTRANRFLMREFGASIAAVEVLREASLVLVSTQIRGSQVLAVRAQDPGSRIDGHDLSISEVVELPDFDGPAGGVGAQALDGGAIELFTFGVSGREALEPELGVEDPRPAPETALAGIQILEGGEIDLHEGVVGFFAVGANVQDAGFDLERVQDRIIYRNNSRNLDGAALPVPTPVAGVPE